MSEQHMLYEVKDKVAWLTINREKQRNAISSKAVSLFLEYLDQAENDSDVNVVCVTGAGDRAFCSGADLSSAMTGDNEGAGQVFQKYADLLKRLAGFTKPTVAKVNGTCIAGGTGFMLACDIVVARDDAKFGTPEVNVGLFPMMIGALIFRNVLRKKAMEMVLLGKKLSAQQALEMGMITRAVSSDRLDTEVDEILNVLAAKSSIGMKIGKEAFFAMDDMPLEKAVDFLSEKLLEIASTQDAKEGITAFLEKRQPEFKGK